MGDHLRALLLRLGSVLLLFTALRWLFYLLNKDVFGGLAPADVLAVSAQGLRFDAMTIVLANAPFILLHALPFPWRERAGYQRMLFVLFILVNGLLLFLCCVDLPFFGFNGKRITRDVLGQAGAGWRLMPGFLLRYWWAVAAFLLSIAGLLFAWQRIGSTRVARATPRSGMLSGAIALGVLGLIGRGGWQYQGLSPAHAADHVPTSLAPLVTNSAFTFGYSLTQPVLAPRRYMSATELDRRAPLVYTLRRDSTDKRMNVVLLIVESLGQEYVHAISGEPQYMPFLDSLCQRSLVLTQAFANAERSNKSMCALLAGIPSFTDDAFMNTAYAGNKVDGLGTRMKELGYSTAFFHGGLNGEYKFDSFSKACGFDRYFGKDEFGDDTFYDGHWGIYDEEFLRFFSERIDELPQPFCAVEFTLSSHDPFPVPPRYKGMFPKGTQEIHESLGYVDMALRRFFDQASLKPWFRNTLFVITGDHTFQYNVHPPRYMNPAGRFAVPIIFFTGDGSLRGTDPRVAQHLDIAPSILDLVGYEGRIHSFGQSVFARDRSDRAVQYLGNYRIIENDRLLLFDGERTLGLFDPRKDTLCAHDLRAAEPALAQRLQADLEAVIQRHREALIGNGLAP